jgi:hypothetical protein
MTYVFFELALYLAWAYVFLSRLRRVGRSASEEMHVLVFALLTTTIMELRAEYLGTGTFYPASLLYFPDFKFPVAIVLAGSLYTWAIYVLSRGIASRIAGPTAWLSNLIHLVVFLLLLLTAGYIESFSVRIGYWQWHNPPDPRAIGLGSYYKYYFRFTFPAALAAKFFSWYGSRSQRSSEAHIEAA